MLARRAARHSAHHFPAGGGIIWTCKEKKVRHILKSTPKGHFCLKTVLPFDAFTAWRDKTIYHTRVHISPETINETSRKQSVVNVLRYYKTILNVEVFIYLSWTRFRESLLWNEMHVSMCFFIKEITSPTLRFDDNAKLFYVNLCVTNLTHKKLCTCELRDFKL